MAELAADLQRQLDSFQDYCTLWKLKVNADKSKIMVFSKGTLPRNLNFNLNGTELEIVNSFNYIGIDLARSGNFKRAKPSIANKTTKAFYEVLATKRTEPFFRTTQDERQRGRDNRPQYPEPNSIISQHELRGDIPEGNSLTNTDKIHPRIINLSHRKLQLREINLLKRGLKFTPTPNEDKTQLGADIDEFGRRLRINYIFCKDNEENEEEENKPLVRNKSDWIPRPTKDKDLEETIKTLKTNSLTSNKNVKDNLTREEKTALQNLKSDKSIIIKEADKGNAVVIMDREYYRDSILNMLQDEMSYEVTDKKLDRQTSTMIKKLLKKHETELFKEEIDYISNSKFSESYFYGLPKIHKSEEISNAISEQNSEYIELLTPNDLKFRPIVGGPNSVTQNLSHFIDIVLKPLCREVPSFIRDDLEFLNHLPKTVNPNSELITFDIVSLYTNIPHDLGITAVKYWLENTENVIENRLTKEFILASLKLILERNIFYFNGTYYHQKKGTAMGTKMAPSYATLVLGYLEQLLYEKMSHKYGNEFAIYIRQNWKRFLDDCFIIWNSDISVSDFHSDLNSLNPYIHFTINRNVREMPFLDILVIITEDNEIVTDIFSKDTDTHMYLNFYSNHPKHVKLNIPFNLASRIITITSTDILRNKRLEELKAYLKKQHYPEQVINYGIQKALTKGPIVTESRRSETTEESSNNLNKIIPFVTTYNPRDYDIFSFMRQIETNLHKSERMDKVLQKKKIINSKRQSKSLKRYLTSSKFDFNETVPIVKKCTDKRCMTCPNLIEESSIYFKNGKHFTVRQNMSCKSSNVIYSLICSNCEEFYVGETKNELRTRMTLHRQQTNHEDLTLIRANDHFHRCSNGRFKIFPLYMVNRQNDFLRRKKEELFINILNPGLNDK
ncbi:uncharacterized protein [Mytilus edulis]|uniref:uncharacterized protein n=1 Tax=Mytilus edulis TaxID=6550 RepID=UPI0039EE4B3F